jgi:hypothetical protein
MSEPKRIQRKRTKGWRMPEGAVYVGRGSKWGNPYTVSGAITAERAVEMYQDYLRRAPNQAEVQSGLADLRGRDLACWCRLDATCHADALLELANVG